MIQAIVHRGEIRITEPIPSDWPEGQPLQIEKAVVAEPSIEEIDRDFALLESMCAAGDPEDDDRLQHALDEAHREAKEQVRREMGLS